MSEPYTPTTEKVRSKYARVMKSDGTPAQAVGRQNEFDRWLAEHDREVAEKAWGEGFDAAEEDWTHHNREGWGNEDCTDGTFNPYRRSTDD